MTLKHTFEAKQKLRQLNKGPDLHVQREAEDNYQLIFLIGI